MNSIEQAATDYAIANHKVVEGYWHSTEVDLGKAFKAGAEWQSGQSTANYMQEVCKEHEWVKATTTVSGVPQAKVEIVCRKCGLLQPAVTLDEVFGKEIKGYQGSGGNE